MRPGEILSSRFVLGDAPLGAGATGVVWPAWDRDAARDVAVKVLHPHLVDDPRALAHLRAEAGAASRLHHAHILRVYGLWSHGEHPLLVTELVRGAVPLEATGRIEPRAAVELTLQVARALRAAHSADLVHGDVRPGNVLVSGQGARLFDFGLAAWVGAEVVGRPGQTAPEVLDGERPGPLADVYGLGLVLHAALTGEAPWDGPTPWAILGAQRSEPPRLPDGLPRGLVGLVRAALHPEPTERPPSVTAFLRDLTRLKRKPRRRYRVSRSPIAPFRPRSAWMVHGTDPLSGRPALVRASLTRRRARRLHDHLTSSGWDVQLSREALDSRDLLLAGAVGLVGAVVVPVVGSALFFVVAWLRSRGVRVRLRRDLPVARAPVPPRELPGGREEALVGGILLLLTAALLALYPLAAIVPGVLALGLVVLTLTRRRHGLHDQAADARLRGLMTETRQRIDASGLPLDRRLGLEGEVGSLERDWTSGALERDAVLLRLESLRDGLGAGQFDVHRPTLAALRRDRGRGEE